MNASEGKKLALAVLLAIFGCGLLVAGMVLPPMGKIDNSVLVAAGEVFVFSAAILGINLSYNLKAQEFKSKLEKGETGSSNS